MGARGMVRAHQRRLVAERQRMLRKAAAGAVGLTAMAAAGQAQAATFTVSNLNDDGAGSLRDAVDQANGVAGADTVTFQAGLTGTIALTSQIFIADDVSIDGPGAATLAVDGQDATQLFAVAASGHMSASFSGLTLTHATAEKYGAAITAYNADVTISSSAVTANHAGEGGGAVATEDGLLTIIDSTFSGNTCDDGGGALYVAGGGLEVTGSTFSGNSSGGGDGGGAILTGGTAAPVTISGSTVSGNSSASTGGGIQIQDAEAPVTVRDSRVTGNTSGDSGGGMGFYDSDGDVLVERTLVTGNASTGGGGNGGGIWFEDTYGDHTTTLRDSTVAGNTALRYGGGVAFSEQFYGAASVVQSTITGNTAANGGGLQLGQTYAGFSLDNSTLSGNHATEAGGGIFRATDDSGAYAAEGDIAVRSSVVSGNTAPDDADLGSIADTTGTVTIGNSSIENPTEPFTTSPAGTVQTGVDPKLGALTDNGGPLPTMRPAADSPLRDAGVANGLVADERGRSRTQDLPGVAALGSDGTDIGAVELQANTAPVVTPGAGVTVTEDTAKGVTGASIADADDTGAAATVTFTVAPVGAGTLTLDLPGATGGGTGSVSATATLAAVNAAIAAGKLVFTPAQDREADASITMTFQDGGTAEDLTKLSDSDSIALDITRVNDVPVVHPGTGTTVTEDTAQAIAGVTISDVDESGNGTATFSVDAAVGTLHLDLPGATGNDSESVSVTGSLADINAALAAGKLVLTPAQDHDADAALTVTYVDADDASDSDGAALTFTPVNDQPDIAAPASLPVTEDTAATITGLSISDVDDEGVGHLTASIEPGSGGTLSLDLPSVTGNGTATVVVDATLADLNAALAAGKLVYTPADDRDTDVALNLSWRDAGSKSDTTQLIATAGIALKLVPVNDAPVVAAGPAVTVTEDSPTAVKTPVISDVDAVVDALGTVTVTAADGTLTLDLPGATGNGTGTVSASATMADVNTAIAAGKLVFTPKQDFDHDTTLTLAFKDAGGEAATAPVALVVNAVNDAPTLAVGGPVTVAAGQSVDIGAITVADVDATQLEVQLAVGEGRLTLASTAGLAFSEGNADAGLMRFSGTLADVRAALAGVRYTAASSGASALAVDVAVNDMGGTGTGGVKRAAGAIDLTVLQPVPAPSPTVQSPPVEPASIPPLCDGIAITMQATLAGKRISFAGVALQRMAGQTVQIRDGAKTVATTVIGPDGTFASSILATTRARRGSVRYQAVTAGAHSAAFKPVRRISLHRTDDTIVGRATFNTGYRVRTARLYRDVSCGQRVLIGNIKLSRQGVFKLDVAAPDSGFAVYRLRVQVGKRLVSWSQPILVLR